MSYFDLFESFVLNLTIVISIYTIIIEKFSLKMIQLFYPDGSIINQAPSSETPLSDRLNTSFKAADAVLDALIKNGFIASGERSVLSADQIEDWVDGIAPCTLTIAIDGDATLQGKRKIRRMTSTLPHATSPFIYMCAL
jgi:hypothetical protein